MKKISPLCAVLLAITCCSSSAAVNLFLPTSTNGSGSFDDTPAGGYSETLTAAPVVPNAGIWHTMNYPGYLNYVSGGPHNDSASLTLDITQTPNSVPFFQATGSLSQLANVAGDTATLGFQFSSYFEGIMLGADPALALTFMGLNLTGLVSAHAGAYVDFLLQEDYYDGVNHIGYLQWAYSNSTPGSIISTTVYPTWNVVLSPVLTNNLITVNGFLLAHADPSSISFTPDPVPEPSTWACMIVGTTALIVYRRRRKA